MLISVLLRKEAFLLGTIELSNILPENILNSLYSKIKTRKSFTETYGEVLCYVSVIKNTFLSFRGHLSTSLFTFKTSGKPFMDFITL